MTKTKLLLEKTKGLLHARWSPDSITPTPRWYFLFQMGISLGTVTYALTLIVQSTLSPLTPLLAFAAVLGIPAWGIIMLIALAVFILGMLIRRTLGVTIGSALCTIVWVIFAITLGIGWILVADGGRYFIPAALMALAWGSMFYLQLKDIAKNGV